MKKLIAVLAVLSLMCGLLTLAPLADDTASISYGSEKVTLTLIDPLDDASKVIDGYGSLGNATLGDGKMIIRSSLNMFDAYGATTDAIGASVWTGMKYIVFSVENTSDGDIYFGFQPTDPNGSNAFLSGELAGANPVRLIDKEGVAKDAKFSGTQAVNGRDCVVIPYRFTGYVCIPVCIMANLSNLSTPLFTGDPVFVDYGFHTAPDDATYIELTILDVYACGDLPEYKEAEATTAAPADTEPTTVTEAPTDTEEPTDTVASTVAEPVESDTLPAETDTTPDTPATQSQTEESTEAVSSSGGCSSAIGVGVLLSVLMTGGALVLRKRK